MRNLSLPALLGVLGLTSACAPASPPESPEPATTSSSSVPPDQEEAAPQSAPPAEPAADLLYPAKEVVPAAAASCPVGSPLPQKGTCAAATSRLATALGKEGPARDQALAELEACQDFPVGLLRALRAELGPAECADVLVEPVVSSEVRVPEMPPQVQETLVALGLGARLRRLAQNPPPSPKERTKEALSSYFAESLFPWMEKQASAMFVMAAQGRELSGYAKGIVAVEAGNADMRFVELAREVPVSEEIEKFQEAKDVYYATLDERLEPRKARGRNAALVGLREMARAGLRQSERIAEARELLSRAYGGRRINALDSLLAPGLPAFSAKTEAERIALSVPTPYAPALLGARPIDPGLVRAYLERGLPQSIIREVESGQGGPEERLLLARGLFESGRTYFQSVDFQVAQAVLSSLLDGNAQGLSKEQKEEATLLRALCVALVAGPRDAVEMIAKGPRFADSLGNLVILDGLAEGTGQLAGRAAFNSAYLRELVAPAGAPEYWRELSGRYREAGNKLIGKERSAAVERAEASSKIERELRKQLKEDATR